jgi:hypothetical protein
MTVRGNHGRALFHRAVAQRMDCQAVPVNKFWNSGVIEDVDRDGSALLELQQRSRGGSVVTNGRNLDAAASSSLSGAIRSCFAAR